MRSSELLRALWRAAWLVACMGAIGCEGVPVDPADGRIELPDASAPPDGGSAPDAGAQCRSRGECEDGDRCTDNTCRDGRCVVSRIEGCAQCASDADCDDAFRCTIDSCFLGICSWDWTAAECDCVEDAHCDDFDAATTDRCVDNRCVHEARRCASDAECDDADRCTTDRCGSGTCASTRIPGCDSGCPDFDGDGHGRDFCGDDCNDADATVYPGATEVCDDGRDNDCDGRADFVDSDCSTGGDTCASARLLTPGTPLTGGIISDSSSGTARMPCGASNFFTITLAETSDVDVTVTLMEPPPPTPVPGCPECTPDHTWEYWYRVFFETSCGDTTTDLGGGGSWCRTWSSGGGFFPGSSTDVQRLRRVPAGTYTVELQASDFFAWMPVAIRYTIDATVTPSAAPACSAAAPLIDGVTATGRTGSGVNAFATDCSGAVLDAEEALHTFTLTERRRVRLEAAGTPDATTGAIPGLRIGLWTACDPASARAHCLEQTGGDCHPRSTMEVVLDPGTYWVTVEGASGGDAPYSLTLATEATVAACAGAPPIALSGSFSGTTTGGADAFRDHRVCGDGYAEDGVYRVEVGSRSRVVLDLVASYSRPMLTLYEGCGERRIAGGRTSARVDLELDPGTYYAVVGGQRPGDTGSYVLNATFVPVSP